MWLPSYLKECLQLGQHCTWHFIFTHYHVVTNWSTARNTHLQPCPLILLGWKHLPVPCLYLLLSCWIDQQQKRSITYVALNSNFMQHVCHFFLLCNAFATFSYYVTHLLLSPTMWYVFCFLFFALHSPLSPLQYVCCFLLLCNSFATFSYYVTHLPIYPSLPCVCCFASSFMQHIWCFLLLCDVSAAFSLLCATFLPLSPYYYATHLPLPLLIKKWIDCLIMSLICHYLTFDCDFSFSVYDSHSLFQLTTTITNILCLANIPKMFYYNNVHVLYLPLSATTYNEALMPMTLFQWFLLICSHEWLFALSTIVFHYKIFYSIICLSHLLGPKQYLIPMQHNWSSSISYYPT